MQPGTYAHFDTTEGRFTVRLFHEQAPRTVENFIGLATGTVKNHVSSLLLKLGVRDRTRAVLRALDLGLLDNG